MAVLNCNFYSNRLGMNAEVCVHMPERRQCDHEPLNGRKYPVLYLLHGHSQDHTSWITNSQIEFLLAETDLIVVMPNTHRAWYTDGRNTFRYFSYLTEELPSIMEDWFPISGKREDRYIAGLSMGGYGAFKAGLRRPDLYAGAASMSGALDHFFEKRDTLQGSTVGLPVRDDVEMNMNAIFGDWRESEGSFDDLFAAAKELSASDAEKPDFYICIGQDDFLRNTNDRFVDFVKKEAPNLKVTYRVGEGIHNWDFWNREIRGVLEHFGLMNYKI